MGGIAEKPRIAIVGAGIAGLALAMGLSQMPEQWDIHVYERAAALSDIGAGLGVAPNCQETLKYLSSSFFAAFREKGDVGFDTYDERYRFAFSEYRDAQTGELLWAGNQPGLCNMHRTAFVRLLADHVDDRITIHFGCKVTGLEHAVKGGGSIDVVYEQCKTVKKWACQLVIGADGIRSGIRAMLLPDSHNHLIYTGTVCYRGVVSMSKFKEEVGDEHLATVPQTYSGYCKHAMSFPIAKGKLANLAVYVTDMDKAKAGKMGHGDPWIENVVEGDLSKELEGWCAPVQVIARNLSPPRRWAIHKIARLPTYIGERTLLIGDAAHAMCPSTGVGAAMGIEDAALLVGLC